MFKNRKQTDPRIENDKSNLISRIVKEDRQVTHISSIRVQAHLYNSKYEQRSDEWFFNMFQLLEEGIETADEELKSEPDNIETLYRKMTNLELLERMDEADKVAEDILSLNPKDRRQMMLKADVLSGKGQYNDAVELFKEAEKM
ncbi:MAG: tetratricopeptide repeat protein, partial [Methanohalobium sp.]|uniref:tetratricopeptide repeat protein n=1 Tax=Methanohalobium sp. TaxID=2837493 RepID=UPI00397AF98B